MTKEDINELQQECIDYILSIPIDVNWTQKKSILHWLYSCESIEEPKWDKLVPCYEDEDGRDCHLIFRFGLTNYSESINDNYIGLYVDIERYSFRSCEWDRQMGFVITTIEQFKNIVNGIIKI